MTILKMLGKCALVGLFAVVFYVMLSLWTIRVIDKTLMYCPVATETA